MWRTLEEFYKSDEWKRFTQGLRMERTNADGFITCAYCGRPIIRKYDCIAHHCQTFLTLENVNDYAVSLNPENIQLVHHVCHNRIHDKLGYIRKEVFLVYGPPLSGVTGYAAETASEGDLLVDMDNIWECISGQERYIHPPRLNAVAFGVRDFLLDCVKTRRGKWNNAYICGGFPLISDRERIQRETGARLVYMETTKEECLQRAADLDRQETRAAYREYIEDWFRKYDRASGI